MYLSIPVKTSTKRKANIVSSNIFSQGSSIESTNVDSNHILFRQKNCARLDEVGRRVNEWSGLGGGKPAGIAFIAMLDRLEGVIYTDLVFGCTNLSL